MWRKLLDVYKSRVFDLKILFVCLRLISDGHSWSFHQTISLLDRLENYPKMLFNLPPQQTQSGIHHYITKEPLLGTNMQNESLPDSL